MDTQLQGRMQPEAMGTPAAGASLWANSMAWRVLVMSSCLLTSLAISAPLVLPVLKGAAATQNCKLSMSATPTHAVVRVTGFVPEDEVLAIKSQVEARVGAKESPKYATQRRVWTIGLHSSFTTTAAVPDGMAPKIGDVVELNSRYRDPSLPCSFVPWTINRVF